MFTAQSWKILDRKTSSSNKARVASIAATTALVAGLGLTGATTASAQGPVGGDGEITTGALVVRYAPSTHSKKIGQIKKGEIVPLTCKVRGTTVAGNDIWYSLPGEGGEWISARYVRNVGQAPGWCTDSNAVGQTTVKLAKRAGPTTSDAWAGWLSRGQGVDLVCKVKSQSVKGNKLWYQTADRQWVSAKYVKNVGKAPSYC